MPRSSNQKLKLLRIYNYLLEYTDGEHTVTAADIIKELERYGISAERKSIYSDLEALADMGVDVQKSADGWFIGEREFDLPELKLLVDAVQSSKFITRKKSGELIKKLEKLTSRHQAVELQRQVFVANRVKSMNESIYYTVDAINNAINADRQLSFRYFDRDAQKNKVYRHGGGILTVSPWAFVLDGENYYMVAYDSAADTVKHYRIDKMDSASTSGKSRMGGQLFEDFDAALYARRMFGMYAGNEYMVTLACKNRLAGVMLDRFGEGTIFVKASPEWLEFNVRAAVSPNFYGWLACFGGDCMIKSPSSVVDGFRKYIGGIAAAYEVSDK